MSGQVKEFSKRVSRRDAYKVYLTILNGTLNLTSKELDIAARLYYYNEKFSSDVTSAELRGQILFSVDQKRIIRDELDLSPVILNNYLAKLRAKGIILENNGRKYLNDTLDISTKNSKIEVTFNLYLEDEPEQDLED